MAAMLEMRKIEIDALERAAADGSRAYVSVTTIFALAPSA